LLPEQVDEVTRAFSERLGLSERERRESAGWSSLWLSR
jgi:hypothetical protein